MFNILNRRVLPVFFFMFLVLGFVPDNELVVPVSAGQNEYLDVDTFDVHPENRWDVDDNAIAERVEDGNLIVHAQDNGTNYDYSMHKELRDSDGDIDAGMKYQDISGLEYWRDVLGDECDYTESETGRDVEGWKGSGNTDASSSTENGYYTLIPSGTGFNYQYFYFDPDYDSNYIEHDLGTKDLFDSFKVRVKANIRYQVQFYLGVDPISLWDGYYTSAPKKLSGYDEWVEWEFSFETGADNKLSFSGSADYSGNYDLKMMRLDFRKMDASGSATNFVLSDRVYVDYCELNLDFEYSGRIDGEIEDTWDFQDSLEYYHDVEDDICDFEDSVEGWKRWVGTETVVESNGWYKQTLVSSSSTLRCYDDGLSITAATYDQFAVEVYTQTGEIDSIELKDAGNNRVGIYTTNIANDTRKLVTLDLSGDPDWTGTETELSIVVDYTTSNNHNFYMNYTFVSDAEYGDVESFTQYTGTAYGITNPKGHLLYRATDTTSYSSIATTNSYDCNSQVFTELRLRIKSLTASQRMQFKFGNATSSYYYNWDGGGSTVTNVPTTWTELSYDLTDDDEWVTAGSVSYVNLLVLSDSGNFDGTEYFMLDYIYLVGNYSFREYKFGAESVDNDQLYNITTTVYNNASMVISAQLYDYAGDIAFYYNSSLLTGYINDWLLYEIVYNRLLTEFSLVVRYGDTYLVNVQFHQNEFTIGTGRNCRLFSDIDMQIYYAVECVAYSVAIIEIDYCKAPFKMREWDVVNAPVDNDWKHSDWQYNTITDDIAEYSNWSLSVPYLDNVYGDLRIVDAKGLGAGVVAENVSMKFQIMTVDKTDGELTTIFYVDIQIRSAAVSGQGAQILVYDINKGLQSIKITTATDVTEIKAEFQVDFSEDRNRMTYGIIASPNGAEEGECIYGGVVSDLKSHVSDISQEYVLSTWYGAYFTKTDTVAMGIPQINILQKDLLSDVLNWIHFAVTGDYETFVAHEVKKAAGVESDPIKKFIEDIQNFLDGLMAPLRMLWDGFINGDWTTFNTALSNWFQGVMDDIGAIASDIFDGIVQPFLTGMVSIIVNVLSALAGVVLTVVTIFIDIILALYDLAWDLVGVNPAPDVLSFLEEFLIFMGDVLGDLPDGYDDLKAILDWWGIVRLTWIVIALILFISVTSAENVGQVFINIFELSKINITAFIPVIRIYIPIGIFWLFLGFEILGVW